MKVSKCTLLFFVLTGLSACQSHRAKEFIASIDSCEQTAFRTLAGGDSLSNRKNQFILKRDFKSALIIARKQDSIYQRMLLKLKSLPEDNIKNGAQLKIAALNYYGSISELIKINDLELQWQLQNNGPQSRKVDTNATSFLQLSYRGLKQDKDVMDKRNLFDQAIKQFNIANGL